MRIPALLTLAAMTALVACGATSGPEPGGPPTSTPSPSATGTPTSQPTSTLTPAPTPTATATTAPSTTPVVPAGFTLNAVSGGSSTAVSRVVDVRVGTHDGYDRLVIEFTGAVPAFTVVPQASAGFLAQPRNAAVTLEGSAGVLIRVSPVAGWMGYTGPVHLLPHFATLREAVQVENFEAVQRWALGIAGTPALRVVTLDTPSRLVVDIAVAR